MGVSQVPEVAAWGAEPEFRLRADVGVVVVKAHVLKRMEFMRQGAEAMTSFKGLLVEDASGGHDGPNFVCLDLTSHGNIGRGPLVSTRNQPAGSIRRVFGYRPGEFVATEGSRQRGLEVAVLGRYSLTRRAGERS